jgi:hypothetical protein
MGGIMNITKGWFFWWIFFELNIGNWKEEKFLS